LENPPSDQGKLAVLPNPRLLSVYPPLIDPENIEQAFIIGSAFADLAKLNGTLRCVLTMNTTEGKLGSVITSNLQPA
jgi:hypothetical protein